MRVLVHDYAGHPFPLQLSRTLARRGIQVLHAYCSSVPAPRGSIDRLRSDAPNFDIKGLDLGVAIPRSDLFARWRAERRYARLVSRVAADWFPDVVLSANAPVVVQDDLARTCLGLHIPFVYWVQDLHGLAVERLLRRRLPVLSTIVGRIVDRMEGAILRRSAHVVAITNDFVPLLVDRGVPLADISVIENWAPIEDLPVGTVDNPWSAANGLVGYHCVVYSGTIGLKHDPDLLLRLARALERRSDVRLVIVAGGAGAEELRKRVLSQKLDNVICLPYQPYSVLPLVLASATVLLANLSRDAGIFSVPSKVLTYLCAQRPIVAAMPRENLAARILRDEAAGVVVDPRDVEALVRTLLDSIDNPARARRLAANGRAYAERTFDIEQVVDRFEQVFAKARVPGRNRPL